MIHKRLKVAHVIPELDLNITGGVGVFLRTLTQYLDRDRVESVIVTFKSDEIDRQFFQDWGIPVFSRLLTAEEEIEPSIQVMEWLIQTFQNLQPDVVHTNLFWGDTLGRQAAYRAKVPVIVMTEHSRILEEIPRWRNINRKLATFTDRIVCVSEAVRQHSRDVDEIPDDRLSVIYNGIGLEQYEIDRGNDKTQGSHFLFVGRLEPPKNPFRLIEAFSVIAKDYPDCQLSIIGDGSLMRQCQDYVNQLKLSNYVHFLGYQPHPWKVAPSGSFFVHCCDFEGFGLSISEAMASGHLCVLPNIDGVPEVATEGSEAIFYEGDCNSLVEAMRYALKMPRDQRMRIINAARARVEKDFDARRMAQQYLDLYQRLYKNRNSCIAF